MDDSIKQNAWKYTYIVTMALSIIFILLFTSQANGETEIESITVDPDHITLEFGLNHLLSDDVLSYELSQLTINAKCQGEEDFVEVTGDENINFTVEDNSIVEIYDNHLVANHVGKTTLTVEYQGKTATVDIEVTIHDDIKNETPLLVIPQFPRYHVKEGRTVQIDLYKVYFDADRNELALKKLSKEEYLDLRMEIDNEKIATLNEYGELTGEEVLYEENYTFIEFLHKDSSVFVPTAIGVIVHDEYTPNEIGIVTIGFDNFREMLGISDRTLTLKLGETIEFGYEVHVLYIDGTKKTVTEDADFTIENEETAVFENGNITALKPGQTKLTMTYQGIEPVVYGGYKPLKIEVLDADSIQFEHDEYRVAVGEAIKLNVFALFEDETLITLPFEFAFDIEGAGDIVEIDNNGNLVAKSKGEATIKVEYANHQAETTVKVYDFISDVIDENGGTIQYDNIKIEIPEGAIEKSGRIYINQDKNPASITLSKHQQLVSSMYEIEHDLGLLKKEMMITASFNPTQYTVEDYFINIYATNELGKWSPITFDEINWDNGKVTGTTNALSKLAVVASETIAGTDKLALKKLFDFAKPFAEKHCSSGECKGLFEAIDQAEKVYNNYNATTSDVFNTILTLFIELSSDEAKIIQDLESLIEEARKIERKDYTDETFFKLQDEIEHANDMLKAEGRTVIDLIDANKRLIDTKKSLIERDKPDKRELESLIQTAKEKTEETYTPSSYTELKNALAEAIRVFENELADQNEVDQALQQLDAAIDSLVERANKATLGALIDTLENLKEDDYTPSTYEVLKDSLSEVIQVYEDAEASQQEVDDAYQKLIAARDSLQKRADKTELRKLLEEAMKITKSEFTDDSILNLETAITAAEAILSNDEATQNEVTDITDSLQLALNSLVRKINKTLLEEVITIAKKVKKEDYTLASYGLLERALKQAESVLNDTDATQEEVNESYQNLQTAIDSLIERKEVNKTALGELIVFAEELKEADYTEQSFEIMIEALKDAKKVYDNESATQEEVDEIIRILENALESLIKTVDKTVLEKLIFTAKRINKADYTEESFAQLEAAIIAAELVLQNNGATQDQVNKERKKLLDAINSLVIKEEQTIVNKTNLEVLLEVAISFKADDFTEVSFKELQVVIGEANRVLQDVSVSQEEVDAVTDKLQRAIDHLKTYEIKTDVITEEIMYETIEVEDDMLPQGERIIEQSGKPGQKTIIYKVTYVNGEEVNRQIESEIIIEPQNEIIKIGTKEAEKNPEDPGNDSDDQEDENGDEPDPGKEPPDSDDDEDSTQQRTIYVEFNKSYDVRANDTVIIQMDGMNSEITMPENLPDGVIIIIRDARDHEAVEQREGLIVAGDIIEVEIISKENEPIIGPFTLTMSYFEDVEQENVTIYYYNEDTKKWEVRGGELDENTRTMTLVVEHFSIYGIFTEALEDGEDPGVEDEEETADDEKDSKQKDKDTATAGDTQSHDDDKTDKKKVTTIDISKQISLEDNTEQTSDEKDTHRHLPVTTTNLYHLFIIGSAFIVLGAMILIAIRKRNVS